MSALISSRSSRHCSIGPSSPNFSTLRTARSAATQAISFEWVKCCGPPRTSQIPSSGPRHRSATIFISDFCSAQVLAPPL
jgi:hypothetical protein